MPKTRWLKWGQHLEREKKKATWVYKNFNKMLLYLGDLDQNTNAERITTTIALEFLPMFKALSNTMGFITTMESYRDQILADYDLDLAVAPALCDWQAKLF